MAPPPHPEFLLRVRQFFHALLFVALAVLALKAFAGAFAAVFPQAFQGEIPTPALGIPLYLVSNIIVLALSAAMLHLLDRRSFRALGLWLYPGWRRETLAGIGIGFALIVLTVVLVVTSGAFRYSGPAARATALDWLGIALLLVVAAAIEELLCRGYAFQRLCDSIGPTGAVLITSAVFGGLHLRNPNHPGWLSTANTVLAGVLLAAAYLKTRGLWLPIALHWSWNFFQGPVFSSNVSGIVIQPRLFQAEALAPAWLSGGAYGLEASGALTVTCAAAIAWLWTTRTIGTTPAMLAVSKRTESA